MLNVIFRKAVDYRVKLHLAVWEGVQASDSMALTSEGLSNPSVGVCFSSRNSA